MAVLMIYVYLFYGFAFIAMGLVLLVQAQTSAVALPAHALRLLVAFAFLHGASEWTHLGLLIDGGGPSAGALRTGGLVLTALSFAVLLQFGVAVYLSTKRHPVWRAGAALVLLSAWGGALVVARLLGGREIGALEPLTRYLLGFPASMTSALALFAASRRARDNGAGRLARELTGAGVTFGVYAILTGLVVPRAPFFPASWLNTETFFSVTRVRVEILRAGCAIAVSAFLTEGLVLEGVRARRAWERLRARAAAELRDNEERVRLATEAARIGMWFWDIAHDRVEWTTAAKRLFGLDPDRPVTQDSFYAALHPDDRERTRQAMARAIVACGDYRNEYRAVWPDGSVHWMATHGRVLPDEAGRPARVLGVSLDITERKQAEQVLEEEAHHREEILAAERAARVEAEKAARLKDDFLATLSHELRTPLTSIVGWAGILRGKDHDEATVARGLEVIERNARNLAQMVEDLLDVNRIISGKAQLDLQPVDLREIVAESVTSVEPSARLKGIDLEVAPDAGPTPTSGDPTRLRQVVWNLLSNAVKFTPPRGRVRVALKSTRHEARIEVSDTGKGIRPEFLPHVFDRFRQADASITRQHGGLGLGLSLVKHYAELHGGTVRVASEGEGRGATFVVTLPLRSSIHPARSPADRSGIDLEGVKVLVVDDDADTLALIQRILEDRRADVVTASSAAKALEAIQRSCPDVLVSDIGMPGEDGYQLIRAVRTLASDQGGRTPAAALTAFARPEDRTRALDAGYQAYLSKPIDVEALLAVVTKLAAQAAGLLVPLPARA